MLSTAKTHFFVKSRYRSIFFSLQKKICIKIKGNTDSFIFPVFWDPLGSHLSNRNVLPSLSRQYSSHLIFYIYTVKFYPDF